MIKEPKGPKGPTRKMRNRLFICVMPIVFLLFGVVLANVGYIAVVNNDFYQNKATQQQLRDVTINANRGTIYDCNMNVLAQSVTVWTVFISPADIEDDEEREIICSGLSEILDVDRDTIYQKSQKDNYYEVIAKKIDKDKADEVRQFVADNEIGSVHLVEDTKRSYPYGNFASTVIGFTGDDNQGLYGIEAEYDEELSGTPGRIVAAKNAKGTDMPFQYEKYYDPQDGNSLVLTIDEVIQHFLEQALEDTVATHLVENRAAGIVMDVNTGEILAMATKPDFDLNDPFTIADSKTLEAINALPEDQRKEALSNARELQWKNKAITELYEPGSVFKVVTGAAALEEKTVSLDTSFNCTGSVHVPGYDRPIKCWKTSGHGVQNFIQAMVNSCNPAFVAVGSSLGTQTFCDYVRAFGFMERTGIDLPGEADSIVYSADDMGPVELASCSFGQSNKITPIQMITAIAAAVNGGKVVEPHVVKQILDQDGNVVKTVDTTVKRQAISEETSATMRTVLEQVVKDNGNAYIPGYRIGGKSGTAQKLDSDDDTAYISSFTAFAPADDPQIAILVIVDTPRDGQIYGSAVATPAVTDILKQTLPYIGVQEKFTEEELSKLEVSLPNLTGNDVLTAKSKLAGIGLDARVVGDGNTVLKQVPARGSSVPSGSKILLYTEDVPEEMTTVPDLTGMSPTQANTELTNRGLNIKFDGGASQQAGAKVISQGIAKDTQVPKGTVVSVQCLVNDQTG